MGKYMYPPPSMSVSDLNSFIITDNELGSCCLKNELKVWISSLDSII